MTPRRRLAYRACVLPVFALTLLFTYPVRGEATGGEDGKTSRREAITLLRNREYFPLLQKAIDGARTEIFLSFFRFKTTGRAGNYPDMLVRSLTDAANRGVSVFVLLERGRKASDENYQENQRTMGWLSSGGVHAYWDDPGRTTHTKVAVVDGIYTFIGSHNLTQSALKYNNEISVMIESVVVASQTLSYLHSLLPKEARRSR